MALSKKIILNNGISVNYHRIVSVNNITNHSSVIEIASYTDRSKREEEKKAIDGGMGMDIFIHTEYVIKSYDPKLDVERAYMYLKTLDDFKDYRNA